MSQDNITYIVTPCPHCYEEVIIYLSELNCRIFRHGTFKESMEQIPPHLNKEMCDQLVRDEKIFGCGKPFRIIEIEGKYKAEICDYI